jgi:nucleoid-associated protein YgaU
MRTDLTRLVIPCVVILALAFTGCRSKDKGDEMAMDQQSSDFYVTSPTVESEPAYQPYDPSAAGSTPTPAYPTEAAATRLTATESTGRHHTVAKGDTLYSLARKYYGDQRRWRDIYEANRSLISDPNKIYVGQRLIIP